MKVIHLFRLSKYKFSLLAPQESGFQLKEKRNKTKQNKTKQNKTKQNKTKQNKTKQNKTKQNKTKTRTILFTAIMESFHSRVQQPCKHIGTEECLHKKTVQHVQDWFGTQTWPPFRHGFGTPIWLP